MAGEPSLTRKLQANERLFQKQVVGSRGTTAKFDLWFLSTHTLTNMHPQITTDSNSLTKKF